MKKIVCFVLFISLVVARENPFIPTTELNTSIMTTNLTESYEALEKQDVNFSKDASLLLNIIFNYQASDGTIRQKVIDVNKTVDSNEEYIISKTGILEADSIPKLDVSVTIPKQKPLDVNITKKGKHELSSIEAPAPVSIKLEPVKISDSATTVPVIAKKKEQVQKPEPTPATKAMEINTTLLSDTNNSLKISIKKDGDISVLAKTSPKTKKDAVVAKNATGMQTDKKNTLEDKLINNTGKPEHFAKSPKQNKKTTQKTKPKTLFSGLNFIKFEPTSNGLKIITKDKMIKHFAYEQRKIVIDFSARHKAFKTKEIVLNHGRFKDITIGWHKGNYRVVIRLNERSDYAVAPLKNEGYILELKR
ncbi:AMIN domain-containing protein [Campylobacter suis]|nr:AMIN domain-containing protein [Campylobacter suis]